MAGFPCPLKTDIFQKGYSLTAGINEEQGIMVKQTGIGCERCERFGRLGYRLDTDRGQDNPTGRVVACECARELCTCGALHEPTFAPAPPYEQLPERAAAAEDETACICWRVRRHVTTLNRLLRDAGIPNLYRGKLREDYHVRYPEGQVIPDAESARGQAVTWLETAVKEPTGKSLFLYGVPGDGKTLLASAFLTEIILLTRKSGLFVNLSRGYFQRLRNTYEDEPSIETTDQVFNRLTRVPFLVLDDIGVERGSAWEIEWLYNLIDARYQNQNRLIVTSNNSLEELNVLSHGRISSRLRHACMVVRLPDVDLRERFRYGA